LPAAARVVEHAGVDILLTTDRMLLRRFTGEFLGWFRLSQRATATDEAEVGYRLRRAWWGQGYATEGWRALIDAAFTDLGLRRVYAETMAVNLASRRVMEKSGMRHVRTFHLHFDDPIPGTEHGEVEYELRRSDWLGSQVVTASP
jgi:RimJ/RimL family protein N-acetyltransferase